MMTLTLPLVTWVVLYVIVGLLWAINRQRGLPRKRPDGLDDSFFLVVHWVFWPGPVLVGLLGVIVQLAELGLERAENWRDGWWARRHEKQARERGGPAR